MSLLIVGGTGTLGRQIVLQAVTKGYKVRCLVRNLRKAAFLKRWGVELVFGDLNLPETIPPCLYGITAIIDASGSRSYELAALKKIDWRGKLALIKAAETAKVEKFIFCSTLNVEQFSDIPFMKIKQGIEINLKKSNINYTVFRFAGFYQGLVEQYAIPLLEDLPILITNENVRVAYIDTQDIAKFCIRTLQLPKTKNKTFFLGGTQGWLSSDIISLCESLSGRTAQVRKIPISVLKLVTRFLSYFDWGQNISDRLSFVEILSVENKFPTRIIYVYDLFKIDYGEIIELNDYLYDYFVILLRRLKDINFEERQKQKKLIV